MQTALTGSGFWPMLSKPAIAIGKHASVPGKYWNGCPAADKEKRFMCIVVEFRRRSSQRCTISVTA